jgi:manganese efflux pump family protein
MLTILFIAIGLAMDAFGVSIAIGSTNTKNYTKGIISSAIFGLFQAIMPIIGWFIGETSKSFISGIDHWIAFLLLAAIGIKMIYSDLNPKHNVLKQKDINFKLIISLAIATSIDALIAGMGLSFLGVPILFTVCVIGFVTFLLSLGGIVLGIKYSRLFHNKTGIIGGIVLIIIGMKILFDHLLF